MVLSLGNAAAESPSARLSVEGDYRLRYEYLDGQFRRRGAGSDQLLAQRILLRPRIELDRFFIAGELQDSRIWLADSGSPIGTDDANAAEILQAHIGANFRNIFTSGDELTLKGGRQTISIGNRRFVSRNGFRNTINGFTGVTTRWRAETDAQIDSFILFPVERRPADADDLIDNRVQIDQENTDVLFGGIHSDVRMLSADVRFVTYIFIRWIAADSGETAATLMTLGGRLYRPSAPRRVDFGIEGARQIGRSRLFAENDLLDHSAHFFQTHVGFTIDGPWRPRIAAFFDLASGDRDPFDNRNNRFDTLFGSRGFEFGHTGIYGLLARSNISSPGLRLEIAPSSRFEVFATYRYAALASSRDMMPTTGLQDTSGASGRAIGSQVELGASFDVIPGRFSVDAGGTYLEKGRFLETAPGAAPPRNTNYFFLQSNLKF